MYHATFIYDNAVVRLLLRAWSYVVLHHVFVSGSSGAGIFIYDPCYGKCLANIAGISPPDV
jgi:hypothetical protein